MHSISFPAFLKKLFNQFVENYQQLFIKTFGYALLWTIFCFAIGQLLAAYSNYDPGTTTQPLSILSYFSLNFSLNTTYSFVDLFCSNFRSQSAKQAIV
jgi:ABC-type spermidine/putrescine transport system permease subunit I